MGWWSFTKAVLRGEHRMAPMTWVSLVVAVVYTVSPIDFIPDWVFPIVGLGDDLGVWAIFMVIATRERHRYAAGMRTGAIDVEGRDTTR